MPIWSRVVWGLCIGMMLCPLLGCLGPGNPSYFPYLLQGGRAERTHAKPAGRGFFNDFDPVAKRVQVIPDGGSMPVKGTQVLIATVFDGNGKPLRKRRVEWLIDGPGTIIECDESGYLPGRGMKVDNKYAVTYTDYLTHTIDRGNDDPDDDFTIEPGQTWCVISSAVEGVTNVTVYVPGINDWERNRVYVKLVWTDAAARFPQPITARAGQTVELPTQVLQLSDKNPLSGYRVRYKILDGPEAHFVSAKESRTGQSREATAVTATDGIARVKMTQTADTAGTNTVLVEVLKPDPEKPGEFLTISNYKTKVIWQAPQLVMNIKAPATQSLTQEFSVFYSIANTSQVETAPILVNAPIPAGLEVVKTEPPAAFDRNTMIWSLNPISGNRQQNLQVIFKPTRLGTTDFSATARSSDGLSANHSTSTRITEAKLQLTLETPPSAVIGEAIPAKVVLTNPGDGAVENIMVRLKFDDGWQIRGEKNIVDTPLEKLEPGQSKTIEIPATAIKGGKRVIQAGASSANAGNATPRSAIVEVQETGLEVQVLPPRLAYVGQEVTWSVIVRNTGQTQVGGLVVRADLPAGVSFKSASDEGKLLGSSVEWNLGTAPAQAERALTVTGVCEKPTSKAILVARATGDPLQERNGVIRTVSLVKPLGQDVKAEGAVEVLGLPSLQLSIRDSADPAELNRPMTYSIRVRNGGTLVANGVDVVADVPRQMKIIRAVGPSGKATIEGNRVVFPTLDGVGVGKEEVFLIDVEPIATGDTRIRVEVRSQFSKNPVVGEEPTRILGRSGGR